MVKFDSVGKQGEVHSEQFNSDPSTCFVHDHPVKSCLPVTFDVTSGKVHGFTVLGRVADIVVDFSQP